MAIYHFSAKTVSRAEGRSAVAAAAYRSGERMVDERTGEICDYTRKSGVVGGDVVLPGGGTMTMTRAQLWNAVEAKHKRGDAIVAREFELALPHELDDAQRVELVATYARELADQYGVAVDYNLHAPADGELNHHAHVMLSACYCAPDGTMGKKAVELDPIHCKRAGILNPMETQRERWQDLCNRALERAGQDARIDHRTLAAQGIQRAPTAHLGPAATAIQRRGEVPKIAQRHAARTAEILADMQDPAALVIELEAELAQARADQEAAKAKAAAMAAPKAPPAPAPLPTLAQARAEFERAEKALMETRRAAYEAVEKSNKWAARKDAEQARKAQMEARKDRVGQLAKQAKGLAVTLEKTPKWRFLRRYRLSRQLQEARESHQKALGAFKTAQQAQGGPTYDAKAHQEAHEAHKRAHRAFMDAQEAEQKAREAFQEAIPREKAAQVERERQARNQVQAPRMAETPGTEQHERPRPRG